MILRFAAMMLLSSATSDAAIMVETVPVGNPGNPPDTRYGFGDPGSVAYDYRIGKNEVTNAQYVECLNAVDPTGENGRGLFSPNMSSQPDGGIVLSWLAPIGKRYSVKPPALSGSYFYDNKPVAYVDWFSALRFANWMNNGQGSGSTEDGAYTIPPGFDPFYGYYIDRNPRAKWFIPNDNEWYKAAYYDPVSGDYHDYATGTNVKPDGGPPSADTGNSANYPTGLTWHDDFYGLTDVGSYTKSASQYGTLDQLGNVWEYVESLHYDYFKGVRGGAWNYSSNVWDVWGVSPQYIPYGFGFRLATVAAPEPNSLQVSAVALILCLVLYRRSTKGVCSRIGNGGTS